MTIYHQCARCGSTLVDSPCLALHHDITASDCSICQGTNRMFVCMSTAVWCEDHPLPGREHVQRHTPEEAR